MIAILFNFLKKYGLGKSEIGVFVHLFVLGLYLVPVLPQLDYDLMMNFQKVIGAFTLSSFVGRIQDQKTLFKALKSVFLSWGK